MGEGRKESPAAPYPDSTLPPHRFTSHTRFLWLANFLHFISPSWKAFSQTTEKIAIKAMNSIVMLESTFHCSLRWPVTPLLRVLPLLWHHPSPINQVFELSKQSTNTKVLQTSLLNFQILRHLDFLQNRAVFIWVSKVILCLLWFCCVTLWLVSKTRTTS